MDSLPFVKDTAPLMEISPEKILAPSIEEVDENPEGLRVLRGQGRYFGVGDDEDGGGIKEAEPKCNNCSQRGHLKKNCPHVICTYCGSMDDHYSQHCPKATKCSNCNERGHYKSQCPKKWKRVFCTLCNSKKHSRERCPSIWRVYLLKEDKKKKSLPMHNLYCYNCGSRGHFGDDCLERRSSRVPNDDGSAFSGDNLSLSLKSIYFQNLQKQKKERSSSSNYLNYDDGFDYEDYEFDDALYDDEPKNNKKSKSKKRNRNPNSNYHPPPYQSQTQKRHKPIRPSQSGEILPPSRNGAHPLDFPRSSPGSTHVSQGLSNSRYNRPSSSERDTHNYKSYNSYKPFRSGTLRR